MRKLTSTAQCVCAVYAPSPVNYPVPEIEQVPDRNPGDLQVVDELALHGRVKSVNGLELQDDFVVNDNVRKIC
jgi:hypothetical protein